MLISMMAYQLMHIARRAMALTLSTAAAGFWAILWPEITALQWAADP